MNDPIAAQSHELAQVLSRINQLMQHTALSNQEGKQEVDIPLLTEIYKPASTFTEGDFASIDAVNQMTIAAAGVSPPVLAEVIDQLIAGMRPLIQNVVKKAVLEESVKAEKLLSVKLEQELFQAVSRRLNAYLDQPDLNQPDSSQVN